MKFKCSTWQLSSTQLVAIVSFYLTAVLNIPFFRESFKLYEFTQTSADYFIYTMPLVLFVALNIVLNILALPIVHKIIIPLLLILGSAISYNSLFFNVYFDRNMLNNVLQTNVAESYRMLTPSYLAWLFCLGILPALVYLNIKIKYRKWYKEIAVRLATIFAASLVIGLIASQYYQSYASFFRNHKYLTHLIVPSNFVGATIGKIKRDRLANQPFIKQAEQVKMLKKDNYRTVSVIVVGETTRAANWGLSGYARQTTPKMAARIAQGDNLFNFSEVTSCGTATAVSVPCLFSSQTRKQYDEVIAKNQDNLIDILNRAGVKIVWIQNNSDSKNVADRIGEINVFKGVESPLCVDGECQDNIMLPELDKELAENPTQDLVVVLHTIGSHGPTYYERYTEAERLFTPTCDTNNINKCSREELVNTYDNSVVYLDQFLDKVIERLEAHNEWKSSLYYFSDHGESLGEKGIYLHGTPYAFAPEEQTHIPMLLWFSPTWIKHKPFDLACVRKNAAKAYSHDNVFHTVFSLMDIDMSKASLPMYDKKLDMLAECAHKVE
ncbi:sulfatase [[Haemophilus] ducreyi]|uniref:phosphoethanolamine transferase n=1 Tax=Haemophilus ducreyi TaxID=730 RepID=UPI0007CDCC49|nr:phosphoethanolamine--lipid A transferase [[Haemophilus] ducreyi]ANF61559.1 sulfatase [[Haemophilus] ducreyi]